MSTVTRRDLLRYGAAATVVVSGAVGAQALSTPSSAAQPATTDPRDFDVEYRGKRITGAHGPANNTRVTVSGSRTREPHQVLIDGRKLALMPIELPPSAAVPAGTIAFISALNHYEPVLVDEGKHAGGLLKLARRAVDTLGDTELTALAGVEHDHGH
ncbi:tyrosinase family oxidase copper chaperone [Actinoplanes awajinensis]|uniref:Uncharacterized protein n=1 Tax=Actinoplanes awajinensis subsp. mycoplanecinus TaxID=135947 RepID=A0A117MLT2_9ACTN|nr:tyrosinase family oxidase copper chaperone [Actinoplanes awajinensis]KUL24399.1 hypothetical protein ADL15_43655 [Actinoplanes awajinensis subsp. mycoplanecinus]